MGKITNLLIGLSVVAFIMGGLIFFMANASSNTGKVAFNQANYNTSYNKLSEINKLSSEMVSESNKTAEPTSFDILGSYLKQGYTAFRLTLRSLDFTTSMVGQASSDVGLNDGSNLFIPMLLAIVVIVIIFAVIIYGVTGRDL